MGVLAVLCPSPILPKTVSNPYFYLYNPLFTFSILVISNQNKIALKVFIILKKY